MRKLTLKWLWRIGFECKGKSMDFVQLVEKILREIDLFSHELRTWEYSSWGKSVVVLVAHALMK